jgi:hypothetical protein
VVIGTLAETLDASAQFHIIQKVAALIRRSDR